MELSAINHRDPECLTEFQCDIFITTLGFESRCTFISRKLEGKSCRKIALSRTDHIKEFAFQENKSYYLEQGFEIISVEAKVPDFDSIFSTVTDGNIHVMLDCTSMSPRWYFEIFRWFNEDQLEYSIAKLRFIYTMARFDDYDPIRKVKKIKDFGSTISKSSKKKKNALILGLGHEMNICESIYKKVNPDLLYLYYADPHVDKKYVEKVFVNNHGLINATSIRNLIAYPIRNGQTIYHSLIDTILPLRDEFNILLIPQGPKIFWVAAMLVNLGYPDTQISYPQFKKPPSTDRHPIGEPVVLDIIFEGEE